VQDLLLVRVTLHLADERVARLPVDSERDHRALVRVLLEEERERVVIQREGLGLPRVPVDDRGDLPGSAKLARDALAGGATGGGGEGNGCHGT